MVGVNNNLESKNSIKRRYCGWRKNDFFPEESFKSWESYGKALRETKTRLKDRLLARSLDQLELQEIRARGQHEMKKTLNWFDLIWFGIGAVMGAGVFVLTGEAARNYAGPAVLLSYLISGISALLSVLCYTEFCVELPVAGGSFAYLRVELGDFIAFIEAGNILFEYIVAGASVARSWTSYFATLCNHIPDDFRVNVSFLAEGYNRLDPIAVVVSVAICVIASLSMKGSARMNSFATIVHIIIIVFILLVGFTKANPANFSTFAPFGVRGILKASAMLFFAYVGFDGVVTLATLCLMMPYTQVNVDAPFTMAFEATGLKWAKFIVAFGALKGMTSVLLANIIGQARYFTHIARTHMAPPILAVISEKTNTPVNATVSMTIANCIVAFFTSLDILSNLLSISTLFIFSLVAIALLVRRYYVTGEPSTRDRNKFVLFLILIVLSSIGSAVYWRIDNNGWFGFIITVAIWFAATLGLKLTIKEARKAKVWGVPFVPWLPSASVAINVFIMGSIDGASFIRFLVWTLFLLIYYLFVGLHASYDAAKETEGKGYSSQPSNIEVYATSS